VNIRIVRAGPRPAAAPAPVFVPDPVRGRVFAVSRDVRSADVTPGGRLRFDALARYLQEAAEDDLADAALREPCYWLVRRAAVVIRGYPAHGEPLRLRTFCSATGPRWAERTTTVTRSGTDLMQATAVWANVARADGRPAPLGAAFHRMYGSAAAGRTVSARLSHPGPAGPQAGRAWPLRATDFDTAGHVNNAIAWAAVEDVLAGLDWLPASAELEYHRPILPGDDIQLAASHTRDQLSCWLLNGNRQLASARLAR
jgi:acyl-ACP thioesterase